MCAVFLWMCFWESHQKLCVRQWQADKERARGTERVFTDVLDVLWRPHLCWVSKFGKLHHEMRVIVIIKKLQNIEMINNHAIKLWIKAVNYTLLNFILMLKIQYVHSVSAMCAHAPGDIVKPLQAFPHKFSWIHTARVLYTTTQLRALIFLIRKTNARMYNFINIHGGWRELNLFQLWLQHSSSMIIPTIQTLHTTTGCTIMTRL